MLKELEGIALHPALSFAAGWPEGARGLTWPPLAWCLSGAAGIIAEEDKCQLSDCLDCCTL